MPPITKVKKEDIIDVAFDIVKEYGMDALNARAIAKKLNCSIQPIFYNFDTMNDLKEEVYSKITNKYQEYMSKDIDCKHSYRQLGKNYIKFASEEPKLFQIVFMSPTSSTAEKFMKDDKIFDMIQKSASEVTKLSGEDVANFHIKMWMFTHGIATLIATKTCVLTEKQINDLLVDEYQALMFLEKNKNKEK